MKTKLQKHNQLRQGGSNVVPVDEADSLVSHVAVKDSSSSGGDSPVSSYSDADNDTVSALRNFQKIRGYFSMFDNSDSSITMFVNDNFLKYCLKCLDKSNIFTFKLMLFSYWWFVESHFMVIKNSPSFCFSLS